MRVLIANGLPWMGGAEPRVPTSTWSLPDPAATRKRAWRAGLVRRAAGFPGSARIRFLEERSDVPEILADTDLLVRASVQEGLPNVILEAMALFDRAASAARRGR